MEKEENCSACNNTGHDPNGMYGICEWCDSAQKTKVTKTEPI